MLDSFASAAESRRGRIYITDYGMQSVEWISMIIGGVITISFTMFFIIDNVVAQKIMTIMISLILSMNLYIAYLLNNPFTGGLRLPDEYFVKLLETFSRYNWLRLWRINSVQVVVRLWSGANQTTESCWCFTYPSIMVIDTQQDCLCERCLRVSIQEKISNTIKIIGKPVNFDCSIFNACSL